MKLFAIMVFAALVSAVSWIQAWIADLIFGKAYHKRYLFVGRNFLMGTDEMRGAIRDAFAGTPDRGKKKKRYYHNWKDVWPTALVAARKHLGEGRDELITKYFAFCSVVAGVVLTCIVQLIFHLVVWWFGS